MQVAVVDRRFAHHGSRSGYHQMVRRQPNVEYIPSRLPGAVGGRPAQAIARRTQRIAYTSTSLGFELATARRMLAHPRALYHVLYGEDDFHYLSRTARLLRRRGGRLVATFHQPPRIFDLSVPQAARILPRLDAALVTTQEQREHLSQWIDDARIHHVPHGVDVSFFSPIPGERPGRGPLRLITVGRWQRDFLVLRQVAEALTGAPFVFVVVSPPEHAGPLHELPNVELHRDIGDEELRGLYRGADALFLPLVEAGANNTLLEALACGLPIAATDLPGVREYVGRVGARLFRRLDPSAAIAALRALESSREALAPLGQRSRERAFAFDLDRTAGRLAEVYLTVSRTCSNSRHICSSGVASVSRPGESVR